MIDLKSYAPDGERDRESLVLLHKSYVKITKTNIIAQKTFLLAELVTVVMRYSVCFLMLSHTTKYDTKDAFYNM